MTEEFDVKRARESLLKEIVSCYNCQPWEGGPVWVVPHCHLRDVLEYCEIDEDHWEEVLQDIQCPTCGTPLTCEWDEVEVKTQYEREYEKKVEAVLRQAQSDKVLRELWEFNQFLSSYPYLGLGDPKGLGMRIKNAIEHWHECQLQPRTWFRARRLNEESRVFRPDEMGAPDPTKINVREGRYNHTGQSFLYLSSYAETAFQEIRERNETLCAMQKFHAVETLRVLDLRHDREKLDPEDDLLALAIIYNGYLQQRPKQGNSWKPEYFVPRFIADCARLLGYEGIWFSSAVHWGENLVVFPEKIASFVPEGDCEVFVWKEKS